MARKKAYHHGNLRQALIDAAFELIEEGGVPALTLREVARRVGVTHAAPKRHFADRGALVAALAEQGFRGLAAHVEAVRSSRQPRDSAERLRALGIAYIEYAIAHPAHLRVMFSPEIVDKSRYPDLQRAADAVHDMLHGGIEQAQRDGLLSRGDPNALAFAAWSMVHGCATLLIDGQARQTPVRTLIDLAVKTLHDGLDARAPKTVTRRASRRARR
jgi:AcrR family transcriptional regulator